LSLSKTVRLNPDGVTIFRGCQKGGERKKREIGGFGAVVAALVRTFLLRSSSAHVGKPDFEGEREEEEGKKKKKRKRRVSAAKIYFFVDSH